MPRAAGGQRLRHHPAAAARKKSTASITISSRREEFDRRRREGEFIECYRVFGNDWYGTLCSEVNAGLRAGKWVVLTIDVTAARAVVEQFPGSITIFVRPGSFEELERRLRGRATENEDALRRRLQTAEK